VRCANRPLREEIFGPAAPIVPFDDDAQAIELANNTEYGLVAYLFTRAAARGLRLPEEIGSGIVGLNRGLVIRSRRAFRRRQAERHRSRRPRITA
jgi:succinate-semialdehyde dehydrogenase/glutarate-semialdehyde dehydrogenase